MVYETIGFAIWWAFSVGTQLGGYPLFLSVGTGCVHFVCVFFVLDLHLAFTDHNAVKMLKAWFGVREGRMRNCVVHAS